MFSLVNFVVITMCLSTIYADQCPDGSFCDDLSTCCKLASGHYGCCPYPSATCCSDGKSCCPANYKCDVQHGQCIPEKNQIASMELKQSWKPAKKTIVTGGVCPGPECSEGCCFIPAGNCCEDGAHCCPPLTTCTYFFGLILCIPG